MLACNSLYLRVLLLPACHSCLQAYIVYLDSRVLVQCAPVLHARDFHLRVNLQKTHVYVCATAIHVILNVYAMRASIKLKSNCTITQLQTKIITPNLYDLLGISS